jgi:phage shock protein A
MPHAFQHTIDLLHAVIHQVPGVFPQDRHREMDTTLAKLENDATVTQEDIEKFIVSFGKEIWPYVEAYGQYYRAHGEVTERETMRAKLSAPARTAFDKFVSEGGRVEDVRDGTKFEQMLAPEIRAEVVATELVAHDAVHEQMETEVSGAGAAEFTQYLEDNKKRLAEIEEKIGELRALAVRAEKWTPEILDKAKTFEQGFAYVERTPTLDDVKREIQYYIDIQSL